MKRATLKMQALITHIFAHIAWMFLFAFFVVSNANAELISSKTEYTVYPTHTYLSERYRFESEAKQACYNFASSHNYNPTTSCRTASSGDEPLYEAGWLSNGNSAYLGSFRYCASYQRYFADVAKCIAVSELPNTPGDPGNNGGQCSSDPNKKQPCLFDPIHPGTGNMWNTETDYSAATGGLQLSRTYNSNPYNVDAGVTRTFGTRWTQSFDIQLKPDAVQTNGIQGTCWRRNDNKQVWCEMPTPSVSSGIPDAVSIVRGDGKKYLFNRNGEQWVAKGDVNARLNATYNSDSSIAGWTYATEHGDRTEHFDADGRLITITHRNGASQKFTYSNGLTNDSSAGRLPADSPACQQIHPGDVQPAGRLLCVTDHWGRQLQFHYDAQGRIIKMLDPANQETVYTYDGPSGGCLSPDSSNLACSANNLTQVRYPDGRTKTYYYNEVSKINNGSACANTTAVGNGFAHLLHSMTGIVDENGANHVHWTYDCIGRATSTYLAGDVNKAKVTYGEIYSGTTSTTVMHYYGEPSNPQTTTTRYDYRMVQGLAKSTALDKPCIECGPVKTRTYDANGNVLSATDWNGNHSCYGYDLGRNLETVKIEGVPWNSTCSTVLSSTTLPTPARRISTQWHPTYRLPVKIAEPQRLTTNIYDDHGNLLQKTVQATSDVNGAQGFAAPVTGTPRSWSYTYNTVGQILTTTDPLGAVTTNTYDNQGNLITVTNAAGHVTTLSDYDPNGRVGKITDPNGLVTTLTYSPRGWLTSRTVGGDTTRYDYDGVGQLKKVTLPDTTTIDYTHDDAHRLTGMSDSAGNRIVYTLDAMGNRIKEEIIDPDGVLTGKVTRVYDALNRLQQITGGVQ